MTEEAYEAIEIARTSGTIRKGTNEVTKTLERDDAELVVVASDVSPKEITMHLQPLSEEKNVPYVEVDSKQELGAAAGLPLSTSAVVVTKPGKAKSHIEALKQ